MPFKLISEECELDKEIQSAGRKLLVIGFSSEGCGPCRGVVSTFEELSQLMPDILFCKVEVGKDDVFTKRFNITGVPKFCFYRAESKLYEFQGGNMTFLKKAIDEMRFERKCEDQQSPYI